MRQKSLSHSQEGGDVRGQDDLRPVRRGGSAGIEIHLGPSRGRTGNPVSESRHLAQAAAQHQERIRFFQSSLDAARRAGARHAQVQRVVVGKQVAPSPRRDDGHSNRLGEPHQGVGAPSPKHARTGEDQWPARICKHVSDFSNQRRVGLCLVVRMPGRDAGVAIDRDAFVQNVGRDDDQDRAGTTAGRHCHGPLEKRKRVRRFLHLCRPLHDRPERRDDVQLLERLAVLNVTAPSADNGDERSRIGPRGVKANGQIAGARTSSGDAKSRPARELSDGRGHEGGGSFVPCRDDPNSTGRQPLQQSQHALARHGEGHLHAGSSQSFGQGCADRDGGALVQSR